jgi:hypothetical protein
MAKSIIASFPAHARLTGYHVEALCLEAAKGYRGAKTVKTLLAHVLSSASDRVSSPIKDVTGQSRIVDAYLGKANSNERRIVADALSGVARRLDAATSVDQWKAILED